MGCLALPRLTTNSWFGVPYQVVSPAASYVLDSTLEESRCALILRWLFRRHSSSTPVAASLLLAAVREVERSPPIDSGRAQLGYSGFAVHTP